MATACADGDLCQDGLCAAGPCSGIPPVTGKCDGDLALECLDGEKLVSNCAATAGNMCGWDPQKSKFACIEEPLCLPQCSGKECGPDGCGGQCGVCPSGWPCTSQVCEPAEGGGCGYYNAVGACQEGVLWYCDSAVLFKQDCAAQGQVCGFAPEVNANQCLD